MIVLRPLFSVTVSATVAASFTLLETVSLRLRLTVLRLEDEMPTPRFGGAVSGGGEPGGGGGGGVPLPVTMSVPDMVEGWMVQKKEYFPAARVVGTTSVLVWRGPAE